MAIMMGKLYDALVDGGTSPAKAIAAAEEGAAQSTDLQDVKSTLRLHTWILTFNTAMIVALVGKAFLSH